MTPALIVAASAALAASPTPSAPAFDLAGSVTLVSRYRFRGIDLSDGKPAVQTSLTLTHRSGLYAGTWTSTLDGFGELGGSNLEVDAVAGWKAQVSKALTLDVGTTAYLYPGAKGGPWNYVEPYAALSTKIGRVQAKIGVAVAPAQRAVGGRSNHYLSADASWPLPRGPLTLTAHLGRSAGHGSLSPGGHYVDWSLGANVQHHALTLSASYGGSTIGDRAARAAGATPRTVGRALVLSLGAAF